MYLRSKGKIFIVLAAVFVTLTFLLSNFLVYAEPSIPQTVKVGISYGSNTINNILMKSETGINISVLGSAGYVEILNIPATNGIKIRKDVYYNVIEGIAAEINYVKAAEYKGEVIGPYHIQVGDVFSTLEEARLVVEQISSISPITFVAYDNGWRVWTQLYLEESECLQQIEVLKNELKDYSYSVIYPDKKRVQLMDSVTGKLLYMLNAEQYIKVSPVQVENKIPLIEYGVTKYRGSLYFARLEGSDMTVYNELPFEEYLYGVVAKEMPALWHAEALKAQAVSSRSYGIKSIGKHGSLGFDLCNTQHCQVYLGYTGEHPNTNKAVDETKGKVVTYKGEIITTYFSSTSGGHTENSENYWTAALPYLRGVDDSYEVSPHSNWDKLMKKDEINAILTQNKINIGDLTDIKPLLISEFGRIIKLELSGTNGSTVLEKEKIRTVFGYSNLKSTWFNVLTDADIHILGADTDATSVEKAKNVYVLSADGTTKVSNPGNKVYVQGSDSITAYNIIPEVYTFRGKGYGHGLGMSQYGAKGMAEAGFNYIQILEHYFTGAKVQ